MASDSLLLDITRRLVDLRSGDEFLVATAEVLQKLLPSEDVLWMHTDFSNSIYRTWRASLAGRDRTVERSMPHLENHPAIQSYVQDPSNIAPRRLADLVHLNEPRHREALRLSQETVGSNQLSMITEVDPSGRGRGWVVTRDHYDFSANDVTLAARLLPILVALDRLHKPQLVDSPTASGLSADGWADLSPRERQVIDLLTCGMTARAIGTSLGITPRTVSKHLEHAYVKLGTHDRLLVALSRR